ERHDGGDVELLGRVAALRELVRERHREARGVRGGDQLLGARLPVGSLGARGPRDRQLAERAAAAGERSLAGGQAARPGRLRAALSDRHARPLCQWCSMTRSIKPYSTDCCAVRKRSRSMSVWTLSSLCPV